MDLQRDCFMQRSCLLFAITTGAIPAVTRSQAVCQYIIRALCSLSMDAGSAGFQVDHTARELPREFQAQRRYLTPD